MLMMHLPGFPTMPCAASFVALHQLHNTYLLGSRPVAAIKEKNGRKTHWACFPQLLISAQKLQANHCHYLHLCTPHAPQRLLSALWFSLW
jgi:hypothetical protein